MEPPSAYDGKSCIHETLYIPETFLPESQKHFQCVVPGTEPLGGNIASEQLQGGIDQGSSHLALPSLSSDERCELQDLRKKVQLQEESLHMEQERSFSLQRELDTERLKSQSQETDAKLERERSASLQKELSEVKENYRLLHEEMRGRLRKTAELVDEVATQVHNTRRVVSPQHAYRHNRRTRKLLKFIMDMDSTSESEDGFVAPVPGSQGQRDGMEGQGSGQPSVQRRLEESSG